MKMKSGRRNLLAVLQGFLCLVFASSALAGSTKVLNSGIQFPDGTTQTTAQTTATPWSVSGSDIYYDSGNVGIGTTSPSAKLDVQSGSVVISNPGIGNVLLYLSTERHWQMRQLGSGASTALELASVGGGGNKNFIITTDGNVGIGKTAPTAQLHLYRPTVTSDALFKVSNGTFPEETLMVVKGNSLVQIGTATSEVTLDVYGPIYQRGSQLHGDYVFEEYYQLESIEDHAEYMWNNKHLKGIPGRKVDEEGLEMVDVGSHRRGVVEELEKAHIYIEQLHKENQSLEKRLARLEALLNNGQ